ncbi:MAG TPA: hypothetical protein VG452_00660 [Egibacteraceae bacterium]|nr:hypothetical protein [Actinomycetota bacterium]HWB70701.1 hypothetical protein [Egibacteraceae bacterium]
MGPSHRWLIVVLLLGLLTFTGAACAGEEVPQDIAPEVGQDVERINEDVQRRLEALEQRVNELEPRIRQELDQGLEEIRQEIRQLQTEP